MFGIVKRHSPERSGEALDVGDLGCRGKGQRPFAPAEARQESSSCGESNRRCPISSRRGKSSIHTSRVGVLSGLFLRKEKLESTMRYLARGESEKVREKVTAVKFGA